MEPLKDARSGPVMSMEHSEQSPNRLRAAARLTGNLAALVEAIVHLIRALAGL